jgi:hypothetical protein|tara:strand:+ start:391 stop:573 length:183 start_codon:yes stop_codon:yes gene_type:complete
VVLDTQDSTNLAVLEHTNSTLTTNQYIGGMLLFRNWRLGVFKKLSFYIAILGIKTATFKY